MAMAMEEMERGKFLGRMEGRERSSFLSLHPVNSSPTSLSFEQ